MRNTDEIRERMEVVDSTGHHVGFVEAVEADAIRLMRDDPDPDAPHRRFPLAWVEHVGQTVRLTRRRGQLIARIH
ncbi:MAG TPA: DUF2171 domain-containing protein [Gemmata sp.]